MASTVTKKANVIIPEVMGEMINAKIEALAKLTPYAKVDTTLVGVPGDTKTVPSWSYIGDAEDFDPELGNEMETTNLSASTTTFTIKCAGKSVGIYQTAINSGLGNPIGQAETQLAKAIAGKVDNDVLDAVLKSKNIVDLSATNALDYESIVNAVVKFEDEEDGIEKVMFISPLQEKTLLLDPMFLSADKFQSGVAVNGAIGKIAGCWVKKSKKIKKDGSGKFINPIIKLEPDSPETEFTEDELPATTIFLKADTKVDHEWFPKRQKHDITAAKYYGVAMTNEAKIVLLKVAETVPVAG
ncbi:MAG: N4-gp56 family major capsid protein [Bullifex sp.]